MMTELREFEAQLKEPFALDDIDFLPKGKVEREGKTLCMALPYADPRVYQDRLNAVAYGEWSTPAPVVVVAGNKLICYVTVVLCGIPHTDVGEATNNEENTGTEAWAQAFKRACSQFGLGRYLYNLEKEWVPFNPQKKQIDLTPVQKQAKVKEMYRKAGIVLATPKSDGQALHEQANGQADTPAKKIGTLLDAFCGNDRPRRSKALREALDIAEGPLPKIEEYTADDAFRVEMYVDSQKKVESKGTGK
jgi:hypothetical protein